VESPAFVFGSDRVRRIRIALGVAVALGVICGVFAILVGTQVDKDGAGVFATVLGIVAGGTILWSFITWRLLDAPERTAKRAVIITGALLVLFALPTLGLYGLGLLYAVLGLVTIFLAVIADEDAGT
jgi:peptidoglycan/LPS O-acetylase OafA/YrhL